MDRLDEELRFVPEELITLIVQKSIGSKPFESTEIQWLIETHEDIGVLYYYNSNSSGNIFMSLKDTDMLHVENKLISNTYLVANQVYIK